MKKTRPRVFATMKVLWGWSWGKGDDSYKLRRHKAWGEDLRPGSFPSPLLPLPGRQKRLDSTRINYYPNAHYISHMIGHIVYSYHLLVGPLIHSCFDFAYRRSNAWNSAEPLLNSPWVYPFSKTNGCILDTSRGSDSKKRRSFQRLYLGSTRRWWKPSLLFTTFLLTNITNEMLPLPRHAWYLKMYYIEEISVVSF